MNKIHAEIVKDRETLRERAGQIYAERRRAFVIHYCCESFNTPNGQARITAVAVRNLYDGQTTCWTIHGEAQKKRTQVTNLNQLERRVLDGLKGFLKQYDDCTFIHWNMRDTKFGFGHLHHRAAVLGCKLHKIQDSQKFDLSSALYRHFGDNHSPDVSASGKPGRLFALAELNKINTLGALAGAEEPVAFSEGNYAALEGSLLRKLDMLSNIFTKLHQGQLKHTAPWRETWGMSLGVGLHSMLNHWLTKLVIAFSLLGGAIAKWPEIITFGKKLLP